MKTCHLNRSVLLIVVMFCPLTFGKVIYVNDDATGANNGISWTDAYHHLQDGLADAARGDEIRVAQGIYKPDLGGGNVPGDREATFQLINGVVMKGGFDNLGNARGVEVYETILSGDLNGDDVGFDVEDLRDEPTWAENSYHVLTGSGTDETAIMDGFTITGGNADGPLLDDDPFDNGRLRCGGGMYNYEGSPTLINCTFSGNFATEYEICWGTVSGYSCRRPPSPGGIYNWKGSPTLANCVLRDNIGGGMYNYEGSVTLTNCTFSGNSAGDRNGGGMCNYEGSVTLTNCIFSGNSASYGGGMSSDYTSVTLNNCTFSRNSADEGGGMSSRGPVTLNNCTFSGNSAGRLGGGMSSVDGPPILTNCIFSGNIGGAIYHFADYCNYGPTLINCTFSGNYDGVILYSSWGPTGPILTNCILWYNTPNEVPQFSTITYSNIQGGWEGEGNIDEDPLFANPGYWADVNDPNIVVEPNDPNAVWIDGDYHLKSQAGRFDPTTQAWVEDDVASPCIDAGDPLSSVMYEPHPRGYIINMGAYGGTEEASKSPFGCSIDSGDEYTPRGLWAAVQGNSVLLSWAIPYISEELVGYNVYRDGQLINTIPDHYRPVISRIIAVGYGCHFLRC
ncbi:right-handed parallel beta-helix repeat-containing protein [Planctomycetota bacterium]